MERTMATANDGIWIIDVEARTLYANERETEILGTSVSEMAGQSSFSYLFPEDLEAARQLFARKRSGEAAPFRFRLRRKDGSATWVIVQGTPMHDVNGVFKGIVGTFSVPD